MKGDVFVAPVGTGPDEPGWRPLGVGTLELPVTVAPADDATRELLETYGCQRTVTVALRLDRNLPDTVGRLLWGARLWRRVRHYRRCARPLAPGCLPASTLARKRGGRRG